jgi:uncharacterized protein (TIGR00251 family)
LSLPPVQPIEQVPGGVRLHLLVQPRASVSEVLGIHDGRIRVRLAAPPVDGAANEALLKYLSRALGVSRGSLEVIAGPAARRKTVLARGVSVGEATRALLRNR